MDAPSMVQRSGDKFIVRSVVSGDQLFVDKQNKEKASQAVDSDEDTVNDLVINEDVLAEQEIDEEEEDEGGPSDTSAQRQQQEEWRQQLVKQNLIQLMNQNIETESLRWLLFNNNNSMMQNNNLGGSGGPQTSDHAAKEMSEMSDGNLPQCKIKRNYSCSSCTYFTQNPRQYLMHLRDTHGEKLIIHECKHCIYASRHYQKLVRHMKMVHGLSVDQDGSHLAIRKRGGPTMQQQQQQQQLQSQLLLSHFASTVVTPKRAKSSSADSSVGAEEINNNSVAVLGSVGGAGGSDHSGEAKGGPSCSSTSSSRNHDKNINSNAPASGSNDTRMGAGVGGGHAEFNKSTSSFVHNHPQNNYCVAAEEGGNVLDSCWKKSGGRGIDGQAQAMDPASEDGERQGHPQSHHRRDEMNNILISSPLTCKPIEKLLSANPSEEEEDGGALNPSSALRSINNGVEVICSQIAPTKYSSLFDLLNANSVTSPPVNNSLTANDSTTAAKDDQQVNTTAAADALMMMMLLQQQQSPNNPVLNNPSPDFSDTTINNNNATINNTTDNNNRLLKCTVCEYETLSRELMCEHEAKDHRKTKFFRCAKCNYVTHIKTRFSKHVKYHSMPMIKCNMCDFRTPYKWNLDRHMKNHGGSGPFKCAACNFTADIKQSLTVHEMNHHDPPVGNAAGGVLSHLQPPQDQQRRRNRVGGSDIGGGAGGNDIIAQQLAEDGTNDLASGLSFHFLEGTSMLSDHLKSVDLIQKKSARPIPNLIPIQAPPLSGAASSSALNLSNKSNDSRSRHTDSNSETSANDINLDQDENSNPASVNSAFKKKHGSFFDKLKEKIGTNEDNLTCNCSHVAKCLSELFIHQKSCQKFKQHQMSIKTFMPNLINNKNSSRCQYCRHRCKSSADLVAHMQNCSNAQIFLSNALNVNIEQDSMSEMGNSDKMDEEDKDAAGLPMENRIFVWNRMPEAGDNNEGSLAESMSGNEGNNPDMSAFTSTPIKQEKVDDIDLSLDMHCTFRRSPNTAHMDIQPGLRMKSLADQSGGGTCLKKVFKCPHCSFWASTASRFHVHIVGHLNKKPFECSLCAYRSNWRWDITKHIRLKTIRDPGHKTAKVLMNDETGRRNYTKYNKYITLMKVTEGDGNLKLMKSGEMTPNQEASLQSPHNTKISVGSSGSTGGNSSSGGVQKTGLTAMQKILLSDTTSANLLKLSQAAALNTDDLLARNDLSALFSEQALERKQTSFKCKKCQFKHPNRLVVLEHVKGHYRDAGMAMDQAKSSNPAVEITPIYNTPNNNLSAADTNILLANSKTLSNFLASQNLLPIMSAAAAAVNGAQASSAGQTQPNGTVMNSGSVIGNGDIVGGGVVGGGLVANQNPGLQVAPPVLAQSQPSHGQMMGAGSGNSNAQAPSMSVNILPKSLAGGDAFFTRTKPVISTHNTQTNDHGEMDEASSGGTVGHNYRSQLSYRCGHCQQVSNWKHVIQRHCRLKHNGNINIEQIGKHKSAVPKNTTDNSNRNTTVIYNGSLDKLKIGQPVAPHQLNPPFNHNSMLQKNRTATSQQLPLLAPLLRGETAPATSAHRSTASVNHQSKEMQEVQNRFSSLINTISGAGAEDQSHPVNYKKQYECSRCSYVTDNKSQFSYHRSLHKPVLGEELKCSYCEYSATKRHLLNQHMRIHQSNADDVIVVESENHSVFPKTKGGSSAPCARERNTSDTEEKTEAGVPSENKENQMGGSAKRKKLEFMCPHCPYSDANSDLVNDHKQFHFVVSRERLTFVCEFCDFNAHSEKTMRDHRKLHFSFLEKGNAAVEFCTTYDNLKLFVATTRSSGSSKDKKIYDEEEIEDENPWMSAGSATTAGAGALSKGANTTNAVNNIGAEMGTGKAIINV